MADSRKPNEAGGAVEKRQLNVAPVPVVRPSMMQQSSFQSQQPHEPQQQQPEAQQPTILSQSSQPEQQPQQQQQQPPAARNPSSYQHSGVVDNIDERDSKDPLCATDYVVEMYEHFRHKEPMTSVRPVYMETQPHINERMRSILVDWLVEVHLKFKLVPETLYLTVNLIDRYLERREVTRPKLQLVGVTALLIASKYEEIYPPELRDLVYICDRAYTRNEVRNPLSSSIDLVW